MYQYPYQQYTNPQQFMQQQYQYQNPSQNKVEVIRVNGIEGANAYTMPSNSSVILLDEHNPIIYFKMTDGAGYPTVTAYTISPYKQEQSKDDNVIKSLEERIAKLEGVIGNGQSNNRQYKQKNDGKSGEQS